MTTINRQPTSHTARCHRFTAVALACALPLAACCEETPAPQCSAEGPPAGGASCTADADCGEPGPCFAPVCQQQACVYETAPQGSPCNGDSAACAGQCDAAGACVPLPLAQ